MVDNSARITDVRDVGTDTVALDLEPTEALDALPGQFVLLRAEIDGTEEKSYYTISSPTVDTTFEVTASVGPDSTFSQWLAGRTPGDTVTVEGPYGNIAYDDEGNVVAIAGGPGIGPAIAIAERATRHGHDAAVIYKDDHRAHRTRLEAIADAGHVVRLFEQDEDDALRSAIEDQLGNGTTYVFGFSEFCDDVTAAIESAGGDSDEAHVESFG